MEKFWMIYSPDGGSAPRKMHYSYASAAGEARRLAGENIGRKFFVLEAMNVATATSIISWSQITEGEGNA